MTHTEPTPLPSRARRREFSPERLDELDDAIVRQLQADGRRAFREIARSLGVSEATVRARYRRLSDASALRVVAIADPFRLGFRVLAFVLINVQAGRQAEVIDALTPWPEVTYISSCTGRADIYIQVVCRSQDDLWELLSHRLPALAGVQGTETFMELKMHKISYRYSGAELPAGAADAGRDAG
ncbi:MAG: Lrp/AsnC family transcriptional regulator [Acidimicrobiales bacterium]